MVSEPSPARSQPSARSAGQACVPCRGWTKAWMERTRWSRWIRRWGSCKWWVTVLLFLIPRWLSGGIDLNIGVPDPQFCLENMSTTLPSSALSNCSCGEHYVTVVEDLLEMKRCVYEEMLSAEVVTLWFMWGLNLLNKSELFAFFPTLLCLLLLVCGPTFSLLAFFWCFSSELLYSRYKIVRLQITKKPKHIWPLYGDLAGWFSGRTGFTFVFFFVCALKS